MGTPSETNERELLNELVLMLKRIKKNWVSVCLDSGEYTTINITTGPVSE